MRARKVDGSHGAIAQRLRALGWKVKDTHALPKFVDLVAMRGGVIRLIECKVEKGTYTEAQAEMLAEGWPIVTLRSVEDATNLR